MDTTILYSKISRLLRKKRDKKKVILPNIISPEKAAVICPPMARSVDPLWQNSTDHFGQNKMTPVCNEVTPKSWTD